MREIARGDIVHLLDERGAACTVAVVVQSAVFSALPSLLICPVTYEDVDAPLLRVPVGQSPETGLPAPAWAMAELLTAVPQDRVGSTLGQVDGGAMRSLDRTLVAVLGIG